MILVPLALVLATWAPLWFLARRKMPANKPFVKVASASLVKKLAQPGQKTLCDLGEHSILEATLYSSHNEPYRPKSSSRSARVRTVHKMRQ